MTTRPEPLRYQVARDYLASVRDMGDALMLASARRFYTALTGGPACTEADRANYREWLDR